MEDDEQDKAERARVGNESEAQETKSGLVGRDQNSEKQTGDKGQEDETRDEGEKATPTISRVRESSSNLLL